MNALPKKIAVLKGGPGSEREVSLATGAGVARALRSLGAEVSEVDVRDENFELPNETELAFIALHGTFGEDGQIQEILERRGIAYTGEGIEGSRIAFDKILSKEKFDAAGVTTPEWEVITAGQRPTLSLPFVLKAPRQGSTVGIYIVKEERELAKALQDAAEYDSRLLVEKFVPARELTVGVLGDQALPILEIIPKGGFYDFTNKYPFLNPGAGGGAEHVCPAQIEPEKARAIQDLALRAHRSLGLQVYSRVDVMLPETGAPTVLEINTIPGMTETSLLPEAAAAMGIGHRALARAQRRGGTMSGVSKAKPRPRNRRVSNPRQRRQQHLLDVNVRSHKATQHRNKRILVVSSKVVLSFLVLAALIFGVRYGAKRLFFENPDYRLTRIEFRTDGTLPRDQALQAAALREGENIFSVNLARVRDALQQLPQVDDAQVVPAMQRLHNVFFAAAAA